MTKSAKQDPPKAAGENAETESDATETETTKAATDAGATVEATTEAGATGDGKPDLDETKRKFREALERKKQLHSEGQGKGAHETGKVNGAHGPAASRRNFRRKSG